MGYCYVIKIEFENNWSDILAEKIADLATLEIVEQLPYTASYGTKTVEIDGLSNPVHGKLVCVKYDGGFFFLFGWLREVSVIIRPSYSKTINKNNDKVVRERITEILHSMAEEYPQ